MKARMWIWPQYALEVNGLRAYLSIRQGMLVARLFRSLGHVVRTTELAESVWADREDGGPMLAFNNLSVMSQVVNKKLKPLGARVLGGRGWKGRCLLLPGMKPPLYWRNIDLWEEGRPGEASPLKYVKQRTGGRVGDTAHFSAGSQTPY